MKKQIQINSRSSLSIEYRTLEELDKEIKQLIKEYGKDATVQKSYYDYGGDNDWSYNVYFHRMENDKEYADRMKQEAEYKAKNDERELAELTRLKEKYEKRD